ncbi:hypothetical protein [Bosea sp. PAMC 26642]|uniref:hypothetical protein n=1 Tax=Bosea sp. (strain PAMC 26642) TaxID=1792307 RepID=UPI0007702422|nr:hypothetical protein [Bosea sp. PAMC 26642]AMJ61069.1 hypothetical protein AXW83_12905 [Bosea sp. PAMC 26642]
MISHIAVLLLPLGLALVAETDPVPHPVYTCKFEAGQIVIEQAEPSGNVTVEVNGQARQYVMDKLKLVPRDQGLPSFLFQPDLKRWQWLNDQGEPIESTTCAEKPALKAG